MERDYFCMHLYIVFEIHLHLRGCLLKSLFCLCIRLKRLNRFWDLGFRIPQGSVKRVLRRINMPLPSSSPPLFKVWIQPQRLEYSECIARYTHPSNETFCLLRIAVRSHMRRWQHGWAYSHLSAFFSFFPSFLFSCLPFFILPSLSLSSPLPSPVLSISSSDSLPLSADPQRQSALFCLSAIVYQHKNTNGQQLKAINSFEVDPLCAWHQPPWLLSPNTSWSIAANTSASPPQNPSIILKDPGF